MSVRSLTRRLVEERGETLRKSSHLTATSVGVPQEKLETPPSAVYKGNRPEPVDESPDAAPPERVRLKPRIETPSADIPGGIRNRFGLKSQRMSEISRSIDAYTSQVTVTRSESEDDADEQGSDSTPITIELQSH